MPPRHPGPVCSIDGPIGRTPEDGFSWMILQRHGRRPLAIVGRTLLYGDNRCTGLPWWSSVTIHETDSARLATVLCHVAGYGPPWRDAWISDDVLDLRATLDRHHPLTVLSWPMHAMEGHGQTDPDSGHHSPGTLIAASRNFEAAWTGLICALFGLTPAVAPYPAKVPGA